MLTTRRVWFTVNVLVTVALLPALFPERDAEPPPLRAAAADTAPVVLGPTELAAQAAEATTTTTTAPPPTPAPTTTTTAPPAPRPAPASTTAAPAPKPAPRPTTTTTTAPPPPPPPPVPARTESGKASWYDHVPGICAHKTLPFGTIVTVTNTANGRSTRCEVGDRGPYIEGWIIDLNPREFEQLAPRSAGVISVRISW